VPMRLVFELIAGTSAPAQARTLANGLAADLHRETLADLRIVISELVANAVKYGPGSPIHVELDVRARDDVRGEVVDRGDTGAAATAPRIVERPGAHGGYGLRLVDHLTARWGVYHGSTHVWFELGG
jgi:anti-sigma regulatory factor (Ser/Thr protein kinase)